MCVKVLADVHEALKVINGASVFAGIKDEAPLQIGEGGTQAPFSQDSFTTVLGNAPADGGGEHFYLCGGNFMWQSFTWLVNHRAPVNMGQVRELQRFTFKHDDPPPPWGSMWWWPWTPQPRMS